MKDSKSDLLCLPSCLLHPLMDKSRWDVATMCSCPLATQEGKERQQVSVKVHEASCGTADMGIVEQWIYEFRNL